MRLWAIINTKNYSNSSIVITKTPHTFSIELYSLIYSGHSYLYHYFFAILAAPNKQFFNIKFLKGLFVQLRNQKTMTYTNLQFLSCNCFVLELKTLYQTLILLYIPNLLCYARKEYICYARRQYIMTYPLWFQLRT